MAGKKQSLSNVLLIVRLSSPKTIPSVMCFMVMWQLQENGSATAVPEPTGSPAASAETVGGPMAMTLKAWPVVICRVNLRRAYKMT